MSHQAFDLSFQAFDYRFDDDYHRLINYVREQLISNIISFNRISYHKSNVIYGLVKFLCNVE